jgi:hypothetical protein
MLLWSQQSNKKMSLLGPSHSPVKNIQMNIWRLGGSLPPDWLDESRDAAAFYFWVKSQDQEQQCLHATTHKGGLLSNKITISLVRLYIKHSCGSSGTASPNSPPLRLDLDPGPHVPRSSSMNTRKDAKPRGPPLRACAINMFEVWTCFHSWVLSLEQQVTRLHFPTDSIPVFISLYLHKSLYEHSNRHRLTQPPSAPPGFGHDPTQKSSSVGRVFDFHVSTGSGH